MPGACLGRRRIAPPEILQVQSTIFPRDLGRVYAGQVCEGGEMTVVHGGTVAHGGLRTEVRCRRAAPPCLPQRWPLRKHRGLAHVWEVPADGGRTRAGGGRLLGLAGGRRPVPDGPRAPPAATGLTVSHALVGHVSLSWGRHGRGQPRQREGDHDDEEQSEHACGPRCASVGARAGPQHGALRDERLRGTRGVACDEGSSKVTSRCPQCERLG